MSRPPIIKNIFIDWIRKHKDLSNRRSAALFYKENPEVVGNIEKARKWICKLRNPKHKNYGYTYRDIVAPPDLIRTDEERNSWHDKIPKAEDTGFSIRHLPSGVNKWLILCDGQLPYYDEAALWCAIKEGKKRGCRGLIKLGDWNDFYQLSDFVKDPRKRHTGEEVNISREIDQIIIKELNLKVIVHKLGNHEYRLERYIITRTPELLEIELSPGVKLIDYKNIFYPLNVQEGVNIIIVKHTDPIRHKTLTLLHGDEYGGGWVSPVNPARGMFLKARNCVISAHSHVTSEHTETSVMDEITTCWSIGCLCNLHPDWKPLNKWNHGFGILTTGTGKYWHFQNYRIVKGKVL